MALPPVSIGFRFDNDNLKSSKSISRAPEAFSRALWYSLTYGDATLPFSGILDFSPFNNAIARSIWS